MAIADLVLTVGTVVLLLALLPTLFALQKPAPATSLLTGGVLAVFAVVYATLSFTFSAAAAGLTAVCWFLLYLQARGKIRSQLFSRAD